MQWKISVFLLVAMLCLAFTGAAAAEDVKCCWEKPCGTEVEQCDQETTFVLQSNTDAQIIVSGEEWYYVDMDGSGDVTAYDLRLTGWHGEYGPNTKVMPENDDAAEAVNDAVVLDNQSVITYADINGNGQFDLYDPVYVDVDNDNEVTPDDIRLTDVPPVDVYSLETADLGALIMDAKSLNDADNQRWSVVTSTNDAGQGDKGMALAPIGSGDIADLLGWVDADNSNSWTCPDKVYINQPHDQDSDWFDEVVTIGDIRLYVPAYDERSPYYDPDNECIDPCGTKVVQGDHDATYALMNKDVTLSYYYSSGAGQKEIYMDMDNDGQVSVGDVRLTDVSTVYDPNTKVTRSNLHDLGHDLASLNQSAIRYAEKDGLPGYSLGDPLYIDADDDMKVSSDDIRLNDVPVFEQEGLMPGDVGEAWTRVSEGSYTEDPDVGSELNVLGDVDELVGYVDSDCTLSWTCPDKLYIQQINGPVQFDNFVTAGDHRLYVPVNDPMSPFYEMEEWPECATKVTLCNPDVEYALYQISPQFGYVERGLSGFDLSEDAAYIDMDDSGDVSIGDVRLNDFTISGEPYEANTKVGDRHAKDLNGTLNFGTFDVPYGSWTLSVTGGNVTGDVGHFDTDCSGGWTCVDALYLQTEGDYCVDDLAVTHGDFRLFIPPDMICDEEEPQEPPAEFWETYDSNEDGVIDQDEAISALLDYFADSITKSEAVEVLVKYLGE